MVQVPLSKESFYFHKLVTSVFHRNLTLPTACKLKKNQDIRLRMCVHCIKVWLLINKKCHFIENLYIVRMKNKMSELTEQVGNPFGSSVKIWSFFFQQFIKRSRSHISELINSVSL